VRHVEAVVRRPWSAFVAPAASTNPQPRCVRVVNDQTKRLAVAGSMATADEEREAAMANYRRKLLTHRVGGRGPDARDNVPPLPQNPETDDCAVQRRVSHVFGLSVRRTGLALEPLAPAAPRSAIPRAAWKPAVRRWEFTRDVGVRRTGDSRLCMSIRARAPISVPFRAPVRSPSRPVQTLTIERAAVACVRLLTGPIWHCSGPSTHECSRWDG
jgi:hypothetical protein